MQPFWATATPLFCHLSSLSRRLALDHFSSMTRLFEVARAPTPLVYTYHLINFTDLGDAPAKIPQIGMTTKMQKLSIYTYSAITHRVSRCDNAIAGESSYATWFYSIAEEVSCLHSAMCDSSWGMI